MKKSCTVFLAICFLSLSSFAASGSSLSYDLSGGSGSRDGETYSEIHLGLNWFVQDWLNWRNSIFTQFGTEINTVYGLDSAALFNVDAYTSNRALGVELYAGPGVRVATEKSNAVFGKAGITFALGGLRIGGGVQANHYLEDRTDKNNRVLGKDETQYFIVLSGGGVL
ncbi:hypothetical protein AZI86_02460 [Bdellovibrio bacteriovorus]|uniref:Outer membrane protein beta-barrel domain-containing protein n=1 Tax=Bdellovibrio bacteriovorus TaxID=959 RepID=A0A150WNQ7_BDEBC|nr:hypothetical protein [Bdellovibrio bacteriovorus]KYG65954.1 hypothetical protein AZI86_02460 [Bdellovibrio bacteriovorus]